MFATIVYPLCVAYKRIAHGGMEGNVCIHKAEDMAGVKTLVAVLAFTASIKSSAALGTDGFTNRGKTFILGFAHNFEGDEPPRILVTVEDVPATVRVSIPGDPTFSPKVIKVSNFSSIEYDLPTKTRFRKQGKSDLGVLVEADADVGVIGVNRVYHSNDAFLALPVSMLGSEYYAVTWVENPFIFLVGAEDNTTCTLTFPPRADFRFRYEDKAYAGGSSLQETVNRLQTLQLLYDGKVDFSGTHVLCSKPVVVYSGNTFSKVHGKDDRFRDSKDHLVEQLTPVGLWGRSYTMIHSKRTKSSILRVMAGHHNTSVTFGGGRTIAIDKAGDFYELDRGNDRSYFLIESDKPVQAVVFDKSAREAGTERIDPSMTVLIPNDNFMNNITVAPLNSQGYGVKYKTYMLIITDASSVGTMLVDRKHIHAIQTEAWLPVVGSDSLRVLTLNLEERPYFLENSKASATFMAYVFGNEKYESYAYPAGISAHYSQVCEPRPQTEDGDKVDNDCDGKVDEEIRNGLDDDGDGEIDEDNSKPRDSCPDGTVCHPDARCLDSKKCTCLPPYVGDGRFECVNPATTCACTTYGDPHVKTYALEEMELPLRCRFLAMEAILPECQVRVWVQGRAYTDNPLLSLLDKVTWSYGEPDGQAVTGYALNNQVFFSNGEKVPFNTEVRVGKLGVRFQVDEEGYYSISSTCQVTVRYRDPVVSVRRPRPLTMVKATTSSLCGQCDVTHETSVQPLNLFRALQPDLNDTGSLSGRCLVFSKTASSCDDSKLAMARDICSPLMNATLDFQNCGKTAEDVYDAIMECLYSICLGEGVSWAHGVVSAFTHSCT